MAKSYMRVSRIHEPAPNRRGDRDVRMVTRPVRLPKAEQNKKGLGNPWK